MVYRKEWRWLWFFSLVIGLDGYVNAKTTVCTANVEGRIYPCVLGRSGVVAPEQKKEGDGATPAGRYALGREIWYRADQLNSGDIHSNLPKRSIRKNDGWSDDPKKPDYNQHVKLPYRGHYENLWLKKDYHDYDVFMTIQYNMNPIIPGKGSAIFLHVAREDKNGQMIPTSGCVAFSKKDLLEIMKLIGPNTKINIAMSGEVSFIDLKK